LHLDENTDLSLPTQEAPTTLHQGRIIAIAHSSEVEVMRGNQKLHLLRGRVQVEAAADERTSWSLLEGQATVADAGGEHELAIGATLVTPVAEPDLPPALTLAPLEEARWSDAFDDGPVLAAAVPPGVGSLTARRPNSNARSQPLRIVDQKVHVTVRDRVAYTEIEQAFYNDSSQELEGTYRFPLPSDASIAGLQLLVGQRWMEGAMVEKQRARRIFKSIVDRVIPRDPALLEWEQGNVFKLKIFPIPAKGQRRVRLSYTQKLDEVGSGRLRYRYPMGGSGSGDTEIENFDFDIVVDANNLADSGPDAVATPMIDLHRQVEGGHLVLSHHARGFVPTHELGVDLPAPAPKVVTHRDRDGQQYFMMTMRPEFKTPESGPIDYVFVVDRSHGIAPELWSTARGIVDTTVAALGPEDRFAVLACDTACDAWKAELSEVDEGNRDAAGRFLTAQDLGGASDLGAMMVRAASYFPAQSGGQRVIMYLGDGVPSSGELSANGLVDLTRSEAMRGVRMQAVALGARADSLVLSAMTRSTGGDLLQTGRSDDIASLARELQFRARVPLIDDLELELPPGVHDVHPSVPPPLRNGEALVVVGKIDPGSQFFGASGELTSFARLRRPSTNEEYRLPLAGADGRSTRVSHPYLPRLWAAAEIAELTTREGHAAKSRIVALSESYTVLSRYTALLALENDAMYRQFGVKRRAGHKDQWRGELSRGPRPNVIASRRSGAIAAGKTATESREASDPFAKSAPAGELFDKADGNRDTRTKNAEGSAHDPAPTVPAGGAPSPQPDSASSAAVPAEELVAKQEEKSGHAGRGDASAADEATPDDAEVFDQTKSMQSEAPEAEEENFADNDWDFGKDGDAKDSPSSASGSGKSKPSGMPSSTPAPSKKKKAAKPRAPSRDGADLGTSGDFDRWGDVPQIATGLPSRPPRPRLRIRKAGSASDGTLARLEGLLAQRDANPGDRNAHRRLVSAAARAGDSRLSLWAGEWAAADPDYGQALIAQADALAREGHPMTMRAYESAAEARPFDRRLHQWLAEALATRGDWDRACSHRRAVVSIDPKRAEGWTRLARCELGAGRSGRALKLLEAGQLRVQTKERSTLNREHKRLQAGTGYAPPSLPSRPALRAKLSWSGAGQFSLAIVDSRGRRLSSVHPEGGVRGRPGIHEDTLTLRKYSKPVYVEVTRLDAGTDAVDLRVSLRTPDGSRTFPIQLAGPRRNARVARVYRR
jgi:tetratricopeptide (TPR) repeat protein